jgi:hypothetical protein
MNQVKLTKKEKQNIKNKQIFEEKANEKLNQKTQIAFDDGTLKIERFQKLHPTKKQTYLRKEIAKKYKFDMNDLSANFCPHCGETALFKMDGYITDEELIKYTGLRHK